MTICTKCNYQIEDGLNFCPGCGAAVADTQPPHPAPVINTEITVSCGKCGYQVEEGLRFCPGCGVAVEEKELAPLEMPVKEEVSISFCSNCGRQITARTFFCAGCGTRVDAEGSAPPDAPPVQNQIVAAPMQIQGETFVGAYAPTRSTAPVGQLGTRRGLVKLILLSIITFGIYAIVFYSTISTDINIIASRYDGRKTMHYCLLLFLIAPITFGIAALVWSHKISGRIGNELRRRALGYNFCAADYWLWSVFGILIIIGPFVYVYKLCKAMNTLAADYNIHG